MKDDFAARTQYMLQLHKFLPHRLTVLGWRVFASTYFNVLNPTVTLSVIQQTVTECGCTTSSFMICTPCKNCQSGGARIEVWTRPVALSGKRMGAYIILVGKPDVKRQLGRHMCV